MKWTDADIDKLFQQKAEGLSFEFKDTYLDEFNAIHAQSGGAVNTDADKAIDEMYQDASEQMDFSYNDAHWQEFVSGVPEMVEVDLSANTDIDSIYRDATGKMDFAYNEAYWQEFSQGLEQPAGVDLDSLYRHEAAELSFDYKDAYWAEMLGLLDRRWRPDFLWFGLAALFLGLLTTSTFLHNPDLIMNEHQEVSQLSNETNDSGQEQSTNIDEITAQSINQDAQLVENSVESSGTVSNTSPIVDPTVDRHQESNMVSGEGSASDESASDNLNEQRNNVSDNTIDVNAENGVDNENVTDNINAVDNGNNGAANDNSNGNVNVADNNGVVIPLIDNEKDALHNEDKIERSENPEDWTVGNLVTRTIHPSVIEKNIIEGSTDFAFPDMKLPARVHMYIEGNAGISQSLISPSDQVSHSFGAGLGVQIEKGRWSITTGVNGIWSFHDDLVLNGEAKVYGFGSDVYRYTLKYDEIYSLEGVLSAGYRFGRHRINVGVRPSFVMNTKVGFTMHDENIKEDRQVTYGHMEGINRFGLKTTLGYSVDLRGGLVLGANIGGRVLNSVNAEYLDGKNNPFPIDGQIYIRKLIRFRK